MRRGFKLWYVLGALTVGAGTYLGAARLTPPPVRAQQTTPATIVALTNANRLVTVSSADPDTAISNVAITGLSSGERIVSIDYRPANGQLYGISNANRLYTITAAGAATQVGSENLTTALTGEWVGMDFNPTVDRIRVTTETGQNLRLHPETGAVAGVDTPLSLPASLRSEDPATPGAFVVEVAYTNNRQGATETTLYAIDSFRDSLMIQGSAGGSPISPNAGSLTLVGSLNVSASAIAGFDISSTGAAYAALAYPAATISGLYSVNLTTGVASYLGDIAGSELVRGLSVVPGTGPTPTATAGTGTATTGTGTATSVRTATATAATTATATATATGIAVGVPIATPTAGVGTVGPGGGTPPAGASTSTPTAASGGTATATATTPATTATATAPAGTATATTPAGTATATP